MEGRDLYKNRILISFLVAVFVFIFIFLISYTILNVQYNQVLATQEKIKYNLLALDVKKELLTSSCNSSDFYSLSRDLDNVGAMIGLLEERYGKIDERVLDQKKLYSLLEIQHFLFIKDLNKLCQKKISTILFFYSNSENNINDAERIGFMLNSLKKGNQSIMIYSFDYDLSYDVIGILKGIYIINKPNILVINEGAKVDSPKNIDEIRKRLG